MLAGFSASSSLYRNGRVYRGSGFDSSSPVCLPSVELALGGFKIPSYVIKAPSQLPSYLRCPSGLVNCGLNPWRPLCTDVQSDSHNCGRCWNPCGFGETCCAGFCVNTSTDSTNCGQCRTVCPSPQICKQGTCQCPQGGNLNDDNNCGTCGNACRNGQHCISGACQCSSGILNDQSNCGKCGTICSSNQQCCADESGTFACRYVKTDANYCGGCGNKCNTGCGQSCQGGTCNCSLGQQCGSYCANPNDQCCSGFTHSQFRNGFACDTQLGVVVCCENGCCDKNTGFKVNAGYGC
jgi:hypothetical protein